MAPDPSKFAGTEWKTLPVWSKAGIVVCITAVIAIGLCPPYEILDGEFHRIDSARKLIWNNPSVTPSRGFWRLNLLRALLESAVPIVGCIFFLAIGRKVEPPAIELDEVHGVRDAR